MLTNQSEPQDITEEDIDKIVGQAMLSIPDLLKPLRLYGMSIYVDGVTLELQSLFRQIAWRAAGLDFDFGEGRAYHVNQDIHW